MFKFYTPRGKTNRLLELAVATIGVAAVMHILVKSRNPLLGYGKRFLLAVILGLVLAEIAYSKETGTESGQSGGQQGQGQGRAKSKGVDNRISTHSGYRTMGWCVIGRNEPTLARWPFVQFKSVLTATHIKKIDAPKDKYTLEFKQPKCDSMEEEVGHSSKLFHQRLHLNFKSTSAFQGVLVQAMHAPFGVGFPFGQFQSAEEFPCKCEGNFVSMTRIAACTSRPDWSVLPPTVAAFHYQELNYSGDYYDDYPPPYGIQSEMHFNFQWTSHLYSSDNVVEFWFLVVYDFDNLTDSFEAIRFGPYDFSFDKKKPPETLVRKDAGGEEMKDIVQHLDLPTPMFPACFPVPIPSCISFTDPDECPEDENEPPQEPVAECGDGGPEYEPKITEHLEYTRIRMEGEFDTECLWKYPARDIRAGTQCHKWTGKMRAVAQSEEEFLDLNAPILHSPMGDPSPDRLFPNSFCQNCGPDPNAAEDEEPPYECRVGQRTCHGAVMIFAYFFFLPVSLLIGRFYKEVLHAYEWCGWRLWVFLHVFIAFIFLILSYFGYLLPNYWKDSLHGTFGYFTLAVGALSGLGWGRHHRVWVLYVMFVVHTVAGYSTWILGAVTMFIGTKLSDTATWVGCGNVGVTVAFQLFLTGYQCYQDRKIGMTPKRLHFPILQVRFEDVYLPDHRIRIGFLVVAILLLFVTSTVMLLT